MEVHSIGTVDNRVIGAMNLCFTTSGTASGTSAFERLVNAYFDEMRRKL